MFSVSRTVHSARSCLSTGEQYLHLPNTCSDRPLTFGRNQTPGCWRVLRNEGEHGTIAHPRGLPPGRPPESRGVFNGNK